MTAVGSLTWSRPRACIVSCTTSQPRPIAYEPFGWVTTPNPGHWSVGHQWVVEKVTKPVLPRRPPTPAASPAPA